MKFSFLIIAVILFFIAPTRHCIAQQNSAIPHIIPPSPSAQAFQRYGNYPVSHTTGVPDISVPIYEIKSGELSLPVTMRYHAAGFKPSDRDGILGLYWTLHTGGSISRDIRGIPDDYGPNGYLLTSKRYNTTDLYGMNKMDVYDYLVNVEDRGQDTEYDIFSYSASGTSGTFSLKGTNTGGTVKATPVLANERKLEQVYCYLEGNTTIQAFDVTNEDGIRYHYGKSLTNGAIATERTGTFSGVTQSNTSWLLTEIISPDLTDTIRFTYNDYAVETYTLPAYNTSVLTDFRLLNLCTGFFELTNLQQTTPSNPIFNYYYTRTIDTILFKNGFLKFNYSTEKKLSSITIFNRENQLIRTIDFTLSSYQSNSAYMYTYNKLDAVTFNSGEVYRFEYNNEPLAVGGEPSEDWWGFYNGSYYPSAMTPPMTMPNTGANIGYSNVSRESNNHMKNLILNKIIYPTGGSTTFNFEMNQYRSNGQLKNAGGLRIASIDNNNGAGNITREVYKYGPNEDSAGRVVAEPIWENLVSRTEAYNWGTETSVECPDNAGRVYIYTSKGFYTYISNYLVKQTNFSSSVHYKEVAKYQVNILDQTENAGKTIYRYNDPLFTIAPSSVASYEYFVSAAPVFAQPLMPAAEQGIYPTEYYDQLLETEYFKRQGSNYLPVRKEINTYGSGEAMPDLTNLRIHHYSTHTRNYPSGAGDYERTMVENYPFVVAMQGFDLPQVPPIVYKAYTIYNKSIRLASKRIEEYEGGQTMVTTEDYSYVTSHGLPVSVVQTGSNGRIYNNSYGRPKDLVNSITDPEYKEAVDSMIRRNMISPLLSSVESVIDWNMESRIQAHTDSKVNYKIWDASKRLVKPKDITKIMMGDVKIDKIFMSAYDKDGNMLQVNEENNLVTGYIWDYRKEFPIAKVTNSNSSDIAYTSFESDGQGNWTYTGATTAVDGSVTGERAYNISNGQISKNGLSSGTEYIVSYWSKSSTPLTIPGNIGVVLTGPTYNSWTYHEHRVKNVTGLSISGTGYIDELRLYPSGAQMATYTYAPLVGMTSECDANNRITYYEYDANKRLKYIRDAQRNILKVMDYQYEASYNQ